MRSPLALPTGCLVALAALALGCGGEDITNKFATGQLSVVTMTEGDDPDPDGYIVRWTRPGPQPIGVNGEVQTNGLESGEHSVSLSGIAENCTAAEGLTQMGNRRRDSYLTGRYHGDQVRPGVL